MKWRGLVLPCPLITTLLMLSRLSTELRRQREKED